MAKKKETKEKEYRVNIAYMLRLNKEKECLESAGGVIDVDNDIEIIPFGKMDDIELEMLETGLVNYLKRVQDYRFAKRMVEKFGIKKENLN